MAAPAALGIHVNKGGGGGGGGTYEKISMVISTHHVKHGNVAHREWWV